MHYAPPPHRSLSRTGLALAMALLAGSGLAFAADIAAVRVQAPAHAAWASADAVVEAVRDTTVASQVPGAVVQLLVRAGDRVQAGQALVHLDAQAAQQNTAASVAQAEAARTHARIAEKELARQRQLFAKQYISQAGLERAQAQYDAAQAQVRAAQAQAQAASAQSGFYVVRAPYAGVVSEVPVALGDMAAPGRPLVRVYDPRALRITATTSQALVQTLAQSLGTAGQAAIELPGTGRIAIEARQIQRLPTVDSTTHTMQLRADLPAGLEGAVPGMFARLWLPGAGMAAALPAVPASAVVRRAEMTGVYVLDAQNHPRLRQVRLGRTLPAAEGAAPQIEVLSGLRDGERVALDPQAAAQVR